MKILTAHEIWKAIHYTNPQKLENEHGFTSESEFYLLDEEEVKKLMS